MLDRATACLADFGPFRTGQPIAPAQGKSRTNERNWHPTSKERTLTSSQKNKLHQGLRLYVPWWLRWFPFKPPEKGNQPTPQHPPPSRRIKTPFLLVCQVSSLASQSFEWTRRVSVSCFPVPHGCPSKSEMYLVSKKFLSLSLSLSPPDAADTSNQLGHLKQILHRFCTQHNTSVPRQCQYPKVALTSKPRRALQYPSTEVCGLRAISTAFLCDLPAFGLLAHV